MKFVIQSVFSKDDVVAFQKVMGNYIQKVRFNVMRGAYFVMAVVFAYMAIYAFVQGSITTAVICVLVTLAVLYLALQYHAFLANSTWKRWKRQNGMEQMYYLFDEDGIGVDGSEHRVPYTGAYACYENSDYYFLFMTKQNCYILKKADFTEGKPELFAPFIARKTDIQVTKVAESQKKQ